MNLEPAREDVTPEEVSGIPISEEIGKASLPRAAENAARECDIEAALRLIEILPSLPNSAEECSAVEADQILLEMKTERERSIPILRVSIDRPRVFRQVRKALFLSVVGEGSKGYFSQTGELRRNLQAVLLGSSLPDAQLSLEVATHLARVCRTGSEYQRETHQSVEFLRERNGDPDLAKALLFALEEGYNGPAAQALQGTSLAGLLDGLAQGVAQQIERSTREENVVLKGRGTSVTALCNSGHEEIDRVLLALIESGVRAKYAEVEFAIASSLMGKMGRDVDNILREKLIEGFAKAGLAHHDSTEFEHTRIRGTLLRKLMNDDAKEKLTELVDCSPRKTARTLTKQLGKRPIPLLPYLRFSKEAARNVRVAAAIALEDVEPALAAKIYDERLRVDKR